ncbi:radical SAM/SPASM domain-containing protein [Tahibacter amnicola]|uniref:SPASM domain-containing protein n=1 Tax=Tahibacter amnicola TaxID=2976241 RepID=A0ABY6BGL4_9GAMM|nr:radical SAM protein [Tahibacter amnicola]MCU7375875.1 SPASM domain-containing protein [Paucibacter sp. O1-1]MDA3830884.1 SPASM domain-containing protein [Paucibacter sp. O1-1]UXI68904.1 SPASM domain-containing protein [Tahibacter amnicola]
MNAVVAPPDTRSLLRFVKHASRVRNAQAHLLPHAQGAQLLLVNGSRLFDLPGPIAREFDEAIARGDEALDALLCRHGLAIPPVIDDTPLAPPGVHAVSLAVAQKCNLGCTYCYAQQGEFGGPAKQMSLDVALRSIDLLLADKAPGTKLNLSFLGGEPLQNRPVLRAATEYAAAQAQQRGLQIGFSITTNGTLVKATDAAFFEQHGFAVTISLDGTAAVHDRLRPLRNGRGSFDVILRNIAPLLAAQRRMQVSARVTVTPHNLDLPATLDAFVALGFHSVGFSPLLRAPNGRDEMDEAGLEAMLGAMIDCGLAFERHVLAGRRYPFLNMINALREVQRGTHRPYPCGAGAGYFGISADGDLAACHRFVGDDQARFGDLTHGIDLPRQAQWLAARHVHTQQPCSGCWARYLCGGGCHHEVLARGRHACDYIRGWLHYTIQAHGRLSRLVPGWHSGSFQGT